MSKKRRKFVLYIANIEDEPGITADELVTKYNERGSCIFRLTTTTTKSRDDAFNALVVRAVQDFGFGFCDWISTFREVK